MPCITSYFYLVSIRDEGGANVHDDDKVVFGKVVFLVGQAVVSETEVNFRFAPSSSLTSFWGPFSPVSPADLYDDIAVGDAMILSCLMMKLIFWYVEQ